MPCLSFHWTSQCRSDYEASLFNGDPDGEPRSPAESPEVELLSEDEPLVPATAAVDSSRKEARTLLRYIFCNWHVVVNEAVDQREMNAAQEQAAADSHGATSRPPW